jgi:putative glycosyltransferase (exosortase G-associated)
MIELFLERALSFGLFWGVWLLIPILVDVSTTVTYFLAFATEGKKPQNELIDLDFYPFVTIVIPIHNSADTLYQCLESIAEQNYPLTSMEVICVNNASEDNSFEIFQDFQYKYPEMQIRWSSLDWAGKSIALNAGIYTGNGKYLVNVDSDVWLDPDAILNVVRSFESDPTLAAATGCIRVDKMLGEGSHFIDIVNYCEVIEYLVAFDVGRRYQNMKNSIFTLSGAFSMFRRDILLKSFLYQTRTVSEDTDLTFNMRRAIRESSGRIGFMAKSIAYVEPIESLARLYSQRVRWQRGEVEVMGVYYEDIPSILGALKDFLARILISDHTLSFIKLTWTFLLPFLYFLGYPLPTIMIALIGMVVMYLILEACTFMVAYRSSEQFYRNELKKIWWIVFFMPLFRYLTYWFRLAGMILALTETKSWKVDNPVQQTVDGISFYWKQIRDCFHSVRRKLK